MAPARLGRHHAPDTPQVQGEQVEGRHRRGEGLRRGDADLGTRVNVQHPVRLARQRAADGVAHGDDRRALGLGGLHRAEGVCRLPRLRERHDERVGADLRVAVPELRSDVRLGRDAGQALDHLAPHLGRVVRRAAGDQDDAREPAQLIPGEVQIRQEAVTGLGRDPPAEGVGDRPGLLVDLLEHEVAVPALLGHDRVPRDVRHRPLHRPAGERLEPDALPGHDGHLAVLENQDVAGVRQDGGHVRRHVVLAVAEPDHHAAGAGLRRDEGAGLPVREHADRVRATDLLEREAHRLGKTARLGPVLLDQVRQYLGVGLRLEQVTFGLEPGLDRQIVLEDAVVHDDDGARAVGVRVSVLLRRPAVRRPPRVPDPERAVERALPEHRLQVAQPAGAPPDLEHPVGHHRDPRGVVPAVFQPLEPVQDDAGGALSPDVPDNPTHARRPPLGKCIRPRAWLTARRLVQQRACQSWDAGPAPHSRGSARLAGGQSGGAVAVTQPRAPRRVAPQAGRGRPGRGVTLGPRRDRPERCPPGGAPDAARSSPP